MVKRFFLVAILLILVLSACGRKGDPRPTPKERGLTQNADLVHHVREYPFLA